MAITTFQPYITPRYTNAGNAYSSIQGANGNIHFYPNSLIGGRPSITIMTETGAEVRLLRTRATIASGLAHSKRLV